MRTRRFLSLTGILLALAPSLASAQNTVMVNGTTARNTGVSAIWVLANLSYAGMRAQGSASRGWRIIAFIFGLPGTILSLIVVREGGERAYGVDLPRVDRGV
jgi:hypothetical protein